jgi:hypothetical protein
MPPGTPHRRAPLSIAQVGHLLDGHAQHVLSDTGTAGAVTKITDFRAIWVVVDYPMQSAEWKRRQATFTGNIQRAKNRLITRVMMRESTIKRLMLGMESFLTSIERLEGLDRNGIERRVGHAETIGTPGKSLIEKDSLKEIGF